MDDEYVHKNPQDLVKERFARLEETFTDISCNISLLVAIISRNIILFRKVGDLNSDIGSDGKLRDNKDRENES